MASQGPTFFDDQSLFKIFSQMKNYENKFGALAVPTVIIAGIQSAGKSTLLSAIVKFPVAYADSDTGNYCPVVYRLRFDAQSVEPRVLLDEKNILASKLADDVAAHMARLKEGQGISQKPLMVEIISGHVPDLEVVDLVGIIPNPAEAAHNVAKQIRESTARFLRKPNTLIVAVVKCTERFKTIADFAFLDKVATEEGLTDLSPRPDWLKHTLVVANRLNQQTQNWSMTEANAYFEEARQACERVVFVALKPSDANPDNGTFEERQQYFQNLPKQEQSWLDSLKTKLANQDPQIAWNSNNDAMFGVQCMLQAVNRLWKERFLDSLPKLMQHVRIELELAKQRQRRAKAELEASNVSQVRRMMKDFLVDFVRQYQALVTGEAVKDLEGNDVTTFRLTHMHTFDPAIYGKTYEEEQAMMPIDKAMCPWLTSSKELLLPEKLGAQDQHLGKEMSYRYVGMASYERSLQLTQYMMIGRSFDNISDDSILNMARGLARKGSNSFPSHDIVLQMAVDQVSQLSGGVEWYSKFLIALFSDYMHPVLEYMLRTARYQAVNRLEHFVAKIRKRFGELVQRQMDEVVRVYGTDLQRLTRYRPVDMINKFRMAALMVPMETIIPTQQMLLPEVPAANNSSQAVVIGPVTAQGQYVPPIHNPRTKKEPAQRELQKLKAIEDMAAQNRAYPKLFNIGDLVQGGFSVVYPMDWSMVDFDYLRNVAYGYYMHITMLLTEMLRSTIHHQFIDFLLGESELKLMKDMLCVEEDIDEQTLQLMVNVDPHALQTSLNNETECVQSLEDIISTIGKSMATRTSGPPTKKTRVF